MGRLQSDVTVSSSMVAYISSPGDSKYPDVEHSRKPCILNVAEQETLNKSYNPLTTMFCTTNTLISSYEKLGQCIGCI